MFGRKQRCKVNIGQSHSSSSIPCPGAALLRRSKTRPVERSTGAEVFLCADVENPTKPAECWQILLILDDFGM